MPTGIIMLGMVKSGLMNIHCFRDKFSCTLGFWLGVAKGGDIMLSLAT